MPIGTRISSRRARMEIKKRESDYEQYIYICIPSIIPCSVEIAIWRVNNDDMKAHIVKIFLRNEVFERDFSDCS